MQLIKIISTEVDKVNRRLAKFLRFGLKDTQTALQAAPAGVDASPIKDMVAVYAPTSEKGETVVVGYINKNQLAGPGEYRTFSQNASGEVQFYIWLKADGTAELGGNTKHLARYEEIEEAVNNLKTALNDQIQKWNAFTAAYLPGGPSTVGTPPTLAGQTVNPSTADITGAKIEEIKTL